MKIVDYFEMSVSYVESSCNIINLIRSYCGMRHRTIKFPITSPMRFNGGFDSIVANITADRSAILSKPHAVMTVV